MNTQDEAALKKYLLGKTSPAEQEAIDLWLMSDEDAYYLMEAAEDDLIDDALAGRLNRADFDLFENHFMAAPERRRKYQFGRSFKRAVTNRAAPQRDRQPTNSGERFWDLFRLRPAWASALFALVLLIGIASAVSLIQVTRLRRDLQSSESRLVNADRDRQELKRQMDDAKSQSQTLADRLQALQGSIARSNLPVTKSVAALTLLPGITRSAAALPEFRLTGDTSLARFSLVPADERFSSFHVSLTAADGREIWSEDKIPLSSTAQGKVVITNIPAQLLSNGEYTFSLSGVQPSGAPESAGRYVFKVSR
jgi:hypothetical protein